MLDEEKLAEKLDEDLAWRKKELSFILQNVKSSDNNTIFFNLRIGIAILYAHWEGYIKKSSVSYLEFIKDCKLNYCDLKINFIALSLKALLNQLEQTNKSSIHNEVVRFLIEDLGQRAKIPYRKSITTKSNLNFELFQDILIKLGLDYSPYELKKNLIDLKLLYIRNNVAHGNYIAIDKNEFLNLYEEVIGIMDSVKEQILDCIESKRFMREISN